MSPQRLYSFAITVLVSILKIEYVESGTGSVTVTASKQLQKELVEDCLRKLNPYTASPAPCRVGGYDTRRVLLQRNDNLGEPLPRCELSLLLQRSFYDEAENIWTVTRALLERVDNDFQSIVHCAQQTSAVIRILPDLKITVSDPIIIRSEIRIVGEEAAENRPLFKCTQGSQLLLIRNAVNVHLRNLQVKDCQKTNGISPIHVVDGEVLIDACLFNRNEAGNGGVISFAGASRGVITNTSFISNRARQGGALSISHESIVILKDVVLEDNTAETHGGAIYISPDIDRGTLELITSQTVRRFVMRTSRCGNNRAADSGGCLFGRGTTFAVYDSDIRKNTAQKYGGGICGLRMTKIVLEDVHLEQNSVPTGHGGGISVLAHVSSSYTAESNRTLLIIRRSRFKSNWARRGGGMSVEHSVSMEMHDCYIQNNTAVSHLGLAGGMFLDSSGYSPDREQLYRATEARQRSLSPTRVRDRAFKALDSNPAEKSESIYSTLAAEIQNVTFKGNMAELSSGAVLIAHGSFLSARDVIFEENSGYHHGAVSVFLSLFTCQRCHFNRNSAKQSAGALSTQSVVYEGRTAILLGQSYLRDTVFRSNRAGNYGGAVLVDGLSASLYLLGNVTFDGNSARGGGAISSEIAEYLNVSDSIFRDNRATEGGGAIAIMFIQFRDNAALFQRVTFVNNTAPIGGAVHAVYNVHTADLGKPRVVFDGEHVGPSIEMSDVELVQNKAGENGGAIYLQGVPTSLVGITCRKNRAGRQGGALAIVGGAVVKARNAEFAENIARDGGALMIDVSTMFHCTECQMLRNTAERLGGGVSIVTTRFDPQPVAFQCDNCDLKSNVASIGGNGHAKRPLALRVDAGGFHVGDAFAETHDMHDTGYVVLRGVGLEANTAKIGGGGILAAHPTNVMVACSALQTINSDEQNLTSGFVNVDEEPLLQELTRMIPCQSWIQNKVEAGGYGAIRASYVSRTEVTFKDCHPNTGVPISRTDSSPRLHPIQITLFDAFGNKYAEPRMLEQDLRVTIIGAVGEGQRLIELAGQMSSDFIRGEAVMREVIVRGEPREYTLQLNYSDPLISGTQLRVELQHCPVGWNAVQGNRACDRCPAGMYNFEIDAESCRTCPDNGECRFWGIEPKKDHWLPFPCFEDVAKCISEEACDYAGRREKFEAFFNDIQPPNCTLSAELLAEYCDIQCSEGHSGRLCGSCIEGYGKRAFSCRKCFSTAIIWILYFFSIIWFLFVIAIATNGNLNTVGTQTSQPTAVDGQGPETQETPDGNQAVDNSPHWASESGTCITETLMSEFNLSALISKLWPRSERIVELEEEFVEKHSDPEGRCSLERRPTDEDLDDVKRTAAETVKLFINFTQVNSMALSINTRWKAGVSQFLKLLGFIGLSSAEGAVSLDCLFSPSTSVPRSISRAILSLFFPAILIFLCLGYWWYTLRREPRIRNRRFVLSVVVVLYVSYVGLTRRMLGMLYCIRIQDGTSPDEIYPSRRYWPEDTSVECYVGSHAALIGALVVPMGCLVSLGFPIFTAYMLTLHKENPENRHSEQQRFYKEQYGFMYRGYQSDYKYWDSTILLRKLILALIVVFELPLGSHFQGIIASFIMYLALLIHLLFKPFSEDFRHLNAIETWSLIISATTFLFGTIVNDDTLSEAPRVLFSICVVVLLIMFTAASVISIYNLGVLYFYLDMCRTLGNVSRFRFGLLFVVQWIKIKHKHRHRPRAVDRRPQNPSVEP